MYLSCRFFKKPFTLLWNILYWSSFLKCNLLSFCLKPFIFWEVANPYKICWKTFSRNTFLPSKHLLVFSVTIFRLLRRLEDVLQIRLEDLLKTSWKTKNCYAEHVLKTSWRHVLKKSWRQTKCLLGISLSNKFKSVSDKSISHISTSDKSRRIQNALIRTQ